MPDNLLAAAVMRVLGIESSCDETAAAVVDDGPDDFPVVISNIISSQVTTHAKFGGVVPEVASREHLQRIVPVVQEAVAHAGGMQQLDGIAVTYAPGLMGALMVGLQFAKSLALARNLPFIGVHHLEGHLSASYLAPKPPAYPYVALIVSGGHTQLYYVEKFGAYTLLGKTCDDAAGEAFDKVAKMLGLGYPGGASLEKAAIGGNPSAVRMPRARLSNPLDFSFSGLKTAASLYIQQHPAFIQNHLADFCASVQEAIVDALVSTAIRAALSCIHEQHQPVLGIVLAGGVAANTRLRILLQARCDKHNLYTFAPPKVLCTDNAAMIAAAGWMRLRAGERSAWDLSAVARMPLARI